MIRIKNKVCFYAVCIIAIFSDTSCASSAYFKTPNDVNKMAGTVYMMDGTKKKGLITILFENGNDLKYDKIDFVQADSINAEEISINKINYYNIDGKKYYPKKVDLYLLGINHILFLECLTPEGSKMHLYKLHQAYKSNATGLEDDYYFISFSNSSKYEVISTNSEKLIPDFDIKMSALVADCPVLSENISMKLKEYNYSFMSFAPKMLSVIERIVKEYNECK